MYELLESLQKSSDYVKEDYFNGQLYIYYYKTTIDDQALQQEVLTSLFHHFDPSNLEIEQLKEIIPIRGIILTDSKDKVKDSLLTGNAAVFLPKAGGNKVALINISNSTNKRKGATSEVEFSVVGAKDAFVESLDTNISLIRGRLPDHRLVFEEMKIGNLSKTRISIAYIEGLTNIEHVKELRRRLESIEFDNVVDISYIDEMIMDNPLTPFPLFSSTERPDRASATLSFGQAVVLAEGSPVALSAPTNFFEFFLSPEDFYLHWSIGSFVRFIRFIAVAFSILATPIYVAVMTYHYQLIPKDLLQPLISSRMNIPFPPVLEVLFLELTIELLREAGARLPTKVGQTLGIVGGIVIGQASVEAGLTSNILLIVVALAALASFTTPIYKMANTIRLLRFPFLLFAAFFGGVGIALVILLLFIHLFSLKSLNMPYMAPFYPARAGAAEVFFRVPFFIYNKRPTFYRPQDPERFTRKISLRRLLWRKK